MDALGICEKFLASKSRRRFPCDSSVFLKAAVKTRREMLKAPRRAVFGKMKMSFGAAYSGNFAARSCGKKPFCKKKPPESYSGGRSR
ncbi:MAG: hypothetical protein DBX55_00045 [Verrucomicrobia bacterium]|nr:MAG: hypothetical protein DBX55_00045 [Verrucomicrobiota bacterium]